MTDEKPLPNMTEEELRDEAQKGFRGQGAIVEIIRRSSRDQQLIKILTVWILVLTAAIFVLTLIILFRP